MADWTVPFMATLSWRRISSATKEDMGLVDGVKVGGSIDWDADSDVKVSASVECTRLLDLGPDWLRCVADVQFQDGTSERVALGTFLASQPDRNTDPSDPEANATLYSTLQILRSGEFPNSYTVAAGSDPVKAAESICVGCGLSVTAEACDRRLPTARTYGIKTTDGDGDKLAAVNDLLDAAGFAAATVDAYGTVLMRRYVVPSGRPIVAEWREGPSCRFLTDPTESLDAFSVANCVKVVHSDSSGTVYGVARNDDPDSKYSVPNVGYERWRREEVSESITAAQARAKAAELLANELSPIRKLTLQRVWSPVWDDEMVIVEYPSGDIPEMRMAVRSQSIDLGAPGLLTTCELRG